MLVFIKKHLTKIISLTLIIILLIWFSEFLKTPEGKSFLANLMGEFPFAKFIYDTVNDILGYNVKLPEITASSVSEDLIKLFISSSVSCLLFRLFSILFLNVRIPKNQILRGIRTDADIIDENTGSLLYRLKHSFFSGLSASVSVLISGWCIEKISAIISDKYSPPETTYITLLALLVFFLAYSVLFAILSGYGFGFSLLKTVFFNVVPNLLSTLGTTFFMLGIYISYTASGFSITTFIWISLFVIWAGVSDYFVNLLKKEIVRHRGNFSINFSDLFAVTAMYFSVASYCCIYFVKLNYTSHFDYLNDPAVKTFFNLKATPLFEFIVLNKPPVSLFTDHLSVLVSSIPYMLLFSLITCVLTRIIRFRSLLAWFIAQSISLGIIIVLYSFTIYCYNSLSSFWTVVGIIIFLIVACLIFGDGIVSLAFETLLCCIPITVIACLLYFVPAGIDTLAIYLGGGMLASWGGWFAFDYFNDN
ncbi:MAG: hypothetical protein IJB74_03855 [Clostridia bacterium]|nr:hypothetical protein [Clostridia bacterium]